jgi:ribonuclease BN (tRNA processing enzyme)
MADHTAGYADFILTPAVLDRNEPLEVFGPKGLKAMTKHLLAAYKEDMAIRIHGLEMGVAAGYRVNVHEVSNGIIYQDSNMVVKTFKVQHGSEWK